MAGVPAVQSLKNFSTRSLSWSHVFQEVHVPINHHREINISYVATCLCTACLFEASVPCQPLWRAFGMLLAGHWSPFFDSYDSLVYQPWALKEK